MNMTSLTMVEELLGLKKEGAVTYMALGLQVYASPSLRYWQCSQAARLTTGGASPTDFATGAALELRYQCYGAKNFSSARTTPDTPHSQFCRVR